MCPSHNSQKCKVPNSNRDIYYPKIEKEKQVKKLKNLYNKKNHLKDYFSESKYQKVKNRKDSKDSEKSTSHEDIEENSPKQPYKTNSNDFKIKYKTELCKYYEINGNCKYGNNCDYAHGIENLRIKVTNTTSYKTKKCIQFFNNGFCPYGSRCQFAHSIKSNILNNPYDQNMSYSRIMKIFSIKENIDNTKNLIEKKRLNIFEQICPNTCKIKSQMFDDIKNFVKENCKM